MFGAFIAPEGGRLTDASFPQEISHHKASF
jgi:hypothetical protein